MVRPDFLSKSGSDSSVSPEGARPGSGSDPDPPVLPIAKGLAEGSPTPGRGIAAGTSPEAAPAVFRNRASQASPLAGAGLAPSSSVLGTVEPPLKGFGWSFSLDRTLCNKSAHPPPPPLPAPASAGGGGTGLPPPKEMGAVLAAGLARSSAAARRAPKLAPSVGGGGGGGGGGATARVGGGGGGGIPAVEGGGGALSGILAAIGDALTASSSSRRLEISPLFLAWRWAAAAASRSISRSKLRPLLDFISTMMSPASATVKSPKLPNRAPWLFTSAAGGAAQASEVVDNAKPRPAQVFRHLKTSTTPSFSLSLSIRWLGASNLPY